MIITSKHIKQMIENMEDPDIIAQMGHCKYTSPCIIGSVFDKELLENCAEDTVLNTEPVSTLIKNEVLHVSNPAVAEGLVLAQSIFDSRYAAADEDELELAKSEIIEALNIALAAEEPAHA